MQLSPLEEYLRGRSIGAASVTLQALQACPADTGIDEEATDFDAITSTSAFSKCNTLYYSSHQAPAQDPREGRALLRILRLIKTSLAPSSTALHFTVHTLKKKKANQVEDFSDQLKYLIITCQALSVNSPSIPFPLPSQKDDTQLHLKYLAPKLFLWAGATSLAFISHLSSPTFKSLPPIFFAGFIISLQAAQNTAEESLALRREYLLKELEALLNDTLTLDRLMEEGLALISATETEYAKGKLPQVHIPDPLLLPTFEAQKANHQMGHGLGIQTPAISLETPADLIDPLIELRECLYQAFAQTKKIYENAAASILTLLSQDELPSLLNMYAPEPNSSILQTQQEEAMDQVLMEPLHLTSGLADSPNNRAGGRPMSIQSLPSALQRNPNRNSWSSVNSPPARLTTAQAKRERRHSVKPGFAYNYNNNAVHYAPAPNSSPLSDVSNQRTRKRMSMSLLDSPFPSTPPPNPVTSPSHSPRSLLLLENRSPRARHPNRISIVSDQTLLSSPRMRSMPSSPLASSHYPSSSPIDLSDPFSLNSLQHSFENVQRTRRKFLCHCLALRTRELYSDPNALAMVLKMVRTLREALMFTCQEIKSSIRVSKGSSSANDSLLSAGSKLPGGWPSSGGAESGFEDDQQREKKSNKRQSVAHKRDSFFGHFAPVQSLEERRKTKLRAFQQKTWLMGQDLRSVASKLNDTAEQLRLKILEAKEQRDAGLESAELDIAQMLAAHDSIKVQLENLFRLWEESRLDIRQFADRPASRDLHLLQPFGPGSLLPDVLSEPNSPATTQPFMTSTSTHAETLETDLTTPDQSLMEEEDDYEQIDKDIFGASEEIYETISGKKDDKTSALSKLSRADRIILMKQVRQKKEQEAAFNENLISELKQVISVLQQNKKSAFRPSSSASA